MHQRKICEVNLVEVYATEGAMFQRPTRARDSRRPAGPVSFLPSWTPSPHRAHREQTRLTLSALQTTRLVMRRVIGGRLSVGPNSDM